MKITVHINEGLLNLFSAKLRSILALLGILVGTASVVAMLSGGELATNEALKQFKTLGTDLLAVNISDNTDKNQTETQAHLSLHAANQLLDADQNILAVAPYIQLYMPIQFNGHDINGGLLGVTENFANIFHVEIAKGRFISDLDHYSFYCVIGDGLYQNIKSYTFTDPIGQTIQIGQNIFTIIGIAKSWPENSFLYANVNQAILIPIQTASTLNQYAFINNIVVKLKENVNDSLVQTHIENKLQELLPGKKFFFRSAKELVQRMAKQSQILTVFLGLIGSVSLIVGGIGVMNIMLVSIVERRREIGIRLAVGATSRDIRTLFLMEAIMLSTIGGLLGIGIGVLISIVIAWYWKWEFTFLLLPPFIGFVVSFATGVFFGFYPAHKASKWDPILALKSE